MDDKNYKRYKRIVEARKMNNRVIWTALFIGLFFILLETVVKIGRNYSVEVFVWSLLAMILILIFGIFYYIYIQFMAKCYRCNKCGKIFVVGFWKSFYKDARMIDQRFDVEEFMRVGFIEEEGAQNRYLYRHFIVKCPYCKERLFWMDNQEKFDEKILRDIDGRF